MVLQHLSIQISVLNRLADVVVADHIGLFKIRQRPRDAEHFVVRTGTGAELVNRVLKELVRTGHARAELARRCRHTAPATLPGRR